MTGATGCDFLIGDESGALTGGRDTMRLCDWGFEEPGLI